MHDDVIKREHFPRYFPFMLGIHRSPVNSPHKGQWRGALMFSMICAWINGWVNNCEAGDLRRLWAHHDVTVLELFEFCQTVLKYFLDPIIRSRKEYILRDAAEVSVAMLLRVFVVCYFVGIISLTGDTWFIYSYLSKLFHWHPKPEGYGCNLSIPNHNKTQQSMNQVLHWMHRIWHQ